jgi:tricorn protease-like protein
MHEKICQHADQIHYSTPNGYVTEGVIIFDVKYDNEYHKTAEYSNL